MYTQFTILRAKIAFSLKTEGSRGKACSVKPGDLFTVTNPSHMQQVGIKIDRKAKARLNEGYLLSIEDVVKLFEVVE